MSESLKLKKMEENSLPIAVFVLVILMITGVVSITVFRIVEEKKRLDAEEEARLEKLMEEF